MTEKQIVPHTSDLQVLQTIARTASSSGLYSGVGNEQKILMILLAAAELGVKPMTALNGGIWNIQGKIEISARLMNSMIRRAGHSIVVKEINKQKCVLEGKRADSGDTFTAQFTIDDARDAGLAGRDVWKKYTEDMLYARAMSRLARRLFSDIIGTAYVEGEISGENSKIIDVTAETEITDEQRKKMLEEQAELEKELLQSFVGQYPNESPEFITEYLNLMCNHWKKPLIEILDKYRDHELFTEHFSKWKSKYKANAG